MIARIFEAKKKGAKSCIVHLNLIEISEEFLIVKDLKIAEIRFTTILCPRFLKWKK